MEAAVVDPARVSIEVRGNRSKAIQSLHILA